MEKKITIGNVCFILDEKHKKILLLHRHREPMKDMVTGVGGKTFFDEDIRASCLREVKEESGLDILDLTLRGVLKTILCDTESSWLLFVYSATKFTGKFIDCDEGSLAWVDIDSLKDQNFVGFIRLIFPYILKKGSFFEGTVKHDAKGVVIESAIHVYKKPMIL